jgi:hypothetical protein
MAYNMEGFSTSQVLDEAPWHVYVGAGGDRGKWEPMLDEIRGVNSLALTLQLQLSSCFHTQRACWE